MEHFTLQIDEIVTQHTEQQPLMNSLKLNMFLESVFLLLSKSQILIIDPVCFTV